VSLLDRKYYRKIIIIILDGPSIDTPERHGAATRRDLERHSAQDGKANAEAGVLLVDSSCEQPGRRGPDLTDGPSIDTPERRRTKNGVPTLRLGPR
jgi:hypothetical protein